MKKLLLMAVLLVLVAIPASAETKKATLINSEGNKVVVEVDSVEADFFFDHGYVLMTNKTVVQPMVGMALPTTLWAKKDLLGSKSVLFDFASTTYSGMKKYTALGITATTTIGTDYIYDNLSLNIKIVNASTSKASSLTITPTYSNDDLCTDPKESTASSTADWFTTIDTNTNYLNSNQNATSTTAAANTTVWKKYTIRDIASKCVRLVFTETNASSTAWVEGVLK